MTTVVIKNGVVYSDTKVTTMALPGSKHLEAKFFARVCKEFPWYRDMISNNPFIKKDKQHPFGRLDASDGKFVKDGKGVTYTVAGNGLSLPAIWYALANGLDPMEWVDKVAELVTIVVKWMDEEGVLKLSGDMDVVYRSAGIDVLARVVGAVQLVRVTNDGVWYYSNITPDAKLLLVKKYMPEETLAIGSGALTVGLVSDILLSDIKIKDDCEHISPEKLIRMAAEVDPATNTDVKSSR